MTTVQEQAALPRTAQERVRLRYPWLVLATFLGGLLAFTGYVGTWFANWSAAALTVVAVVTAYHRSGKDLFHPLVFPTAYTSYVVLSPWFYLTATQRPLKLIQVDSLERPAGRILALFVLGVLAGAALVTSRPDPGPSRPRRRRRRRARGRDRDRAGADPAVYRGLASIGSGLLLLLIPLKAAQVVLAGGRRYGDNQTAYDSFAQVTVLVEGLLLVAVLMICAGNTHAGRPPMTRIQLLAFGSIVGASMLLLGSRSDAIGPVLVVLYFWSRHRRLRLGVLAVGVVLVVQAFNAVGDSRDKPSEAVYDPVKARTSALERSLVDTSSPYLITDLIALNVPSAYPFMYGRTYLETAKMSAPGFVSQRLLNGEQPRTGSYVLRRMVPLGNGNGLGFALPSELYLNFGVPGAWLGGIGLGALSGWAYRRSLRPRGTFMDFAHIVLVAAAPYGIRSDALTQVKTTVYPLLMAGAVILVSRRNRHRWRER